MQPIYSFAYVGLTATNHSLAVNFFSIFFDAPPLFWDIRSLEKVNKN